MSDDHGSLIARADWVAQHPGEVSPEELEHLVAKLAVAVRSLTPETPETRWANEETP